MTQELKSAFDAINEARVNRGQSELNERGFEIFASQNEGKDLVATDAEDYAFWLAERKRDEMDAEWNAEYSESLDINGWGE